MASRTPRLICEYLNIHKSYLFPLCVSDCVNYKKLNLKHKNRRAPISPKTNDEAIVFGKMDVSQKKNQRHRIPHEAPRTFLETRTSCERLSSVMQITVKLLLQAKMRQIRKVVYLHYLNLTSLK